MSREETDLATHVEICAIRYQGIQDKISDLDARLDKVEQAVSELKQQTQAGFHEIKVLLERQAMAKQTTLITTVGAILVAVISAIGYILHQ
jgi:chaperonin cofactor prefoldin